MAWSRSRCLTGRRPGELLDQLEPLRERFLREMGTRFVFPSDEFYCLSGRPLPPDEAYEGYPQIENGVGILRQFETDARWAREDLEGMPRRPPSVM